MAGKIGVILEKISQFLSSRITRTWQTSGIHIAWQSIGTTPNQRLSRFQSGLAEGSMGGWMAKRETVGLEAVLALAKQLSAVDKLKLVEHVLVELEPIVERKGPREGRSSQHALKGKAFTEAEVEEIERKLGRANEARRPKRVLQLEGLWKDVPFDVGTSEIRQARRELSEGLTCRAERH
jgi:hypothetical protein